MTSAECAETAEESCQPCNPVNKDADSDRRCVDAGSTVHTSRQSSRQRMKTTTSAPLRLSGRQNRRSNTPIEIGSGIGIEIER
jgi:hypothetical protein